MTHLIVLLVLVLPTAATRPAAVATPLSPSQLEQLHLQAVELMRQGDFAHATDPLEKVWNALPPDKRPRALVLNHAVLDLTQKKFAMRGVRDLSAYLTRHREDDEPATNLLAALLNATADE